jgi:outer membrane immunogenic protein
VKDVVGPYDWRGFYFGINAGWADVNVDHSLVGPPFWAVAPNGPGAFTQDLRNMTFGGHFGYNFTSGPWVFGVDATLSTGGGADTVVSPFFPSDRFTTEVELLTTVTGRLGYAFNRTLYYAKGGYAGADIKSTAFDSASSVAGVCGPPLSVLCHAGGSQWHNGWTVGAGLEHAIHPNVTLGIEYNYIDLGSERQVTATSAAAGTIALNQSADVLIHAVTARVSVKLP